PGVHPSVASHSPAKVAEERSQPLLAAVPAAGTIAASGPPDGVEVVGEPEMDTAADPAESPPDPDTTVSGPPTNESPAVAVADEPPQKLVIASADKPRAPRTFDPLAIDPEE